MMQNQFRLPSNLLLSLSLTILLVHFIFITTLIVVGLSFVGISNDTRVLSVIQFCTSIFQSSFTVDALNGNLRIIGFIILLLSIVLLSKVISGFVRLIFQILKTKILLRNIRLVSHQLGRVVIIPTDISLAFVGGFRKPILYISIWTLKNLTDEEIEAVMIHEITHLDKYDQFRNLIYQFISLTIPFMDISRIGNLLSEIYADREVIHHQGTPRHLFTGLSKFLLNDQKLFATSSFTSDLTERISYSKGSSGIDFIHKIIKNGMYPLILLAISVVLFMGNNRVVSASEGLLQSGMNTESCRIVNITHESNSVSQTLKGVLFTPVSNH